MATAELIAQFRAVFPEFSDTDDYPEATIGFYLDLAAEIYSCSETAQLYLAAHFLTIDSAAGVGFGGDGSGGSVGSGSGFATAKKVGDLSISRKGPDRFDDSQYASTPYGVRFLQLKKMATPRVVF